MKLWSGRFEVDTDALVDSLNASIEFDQRMFHEDITGSMAHATMLGAQGIIPQDEADLIVKTLGEILDDCHAGKIQFTTENEDIHMNVEVLLTERIGAAGKRLHTARSRNDQVAVDLKMYLRAQISDLIIKVETLILAICDKAEENLHSIMAGYTHLQRAQPSTFAHYTMAYAEMLTRDLSRLKDCQLRLNQCPLGSGAMGGTTYPIDRHMTAKSLGFDKPTENSIDGVSDRDYALELASDLSILMMHLSRFSEEIILWASYEFGFIHLDDAYSTGSSIMPQKKNPDIAELVRGKTGRVYGDLMGLLTVMKGIPLAYNKDMQEDKEAIFDAVDTVMLCLDVFTPMFVTMTVRTENLRKAAAEGFINATDCADYLVKNGMPFRDAYTCVGKLVHYCIDKRKTLETLTLEEYKAVSPAFEDGVYQAIDLLNCLNDRMVMGGPAPDMVKNHIDTTRELLKK
ncbi:MAG: argininosuccinate lyase [Eubacteriales bacterium]